MNKSEAAEIERLRAAEAELARIRREVAAWIRHGEAVPADVTTYDRDVVNYELRQIVGER